MTEQLYQSSDAPDSIITACLNLMQAGGLRAASVRAIAREANISSALVNYHFETSARLHSAVMVRAAEQEAVFWQHLARVLSPQSHDAACLADLAHAAIACAHAGRAHAVMPWLRLGQAGETPAVLAAHGAAHRAQADFWQAVPLPVAAGPQAPGLLHALSAGLGFGFVLAGHSPDFAVWSRHVAETFAARLAGDDAFMRRDTPLRARAEAAAEEPAASPAPTRAIIVQAVADILRTSGSDSLTHRRVVERTGVSLSSISHFFPTRADMLIAGFGRIHDDIANAAARPILTGRASYDGERLTEALDTADEATRLARRQELAVMNEIMLAASRDPRSHPLAISMFARSGATSGALLSRLERPRRDIGRLDAHLFRLVANGISSIADDRHTARQLMRALIGLFEHP